MILDPPPISGSATNGKFRNGTIVKITPVADPGYAFSGWRDGLKGFAKPDSILLDSDSSLTAIFTEIPAPVFPSGIWLSQEEINRLPVSGVSWENLKAEADKPAANPNLES